MTSNYYEVLWFYTDKTHKEQNFACYMSKEFKTRKSAMQFYNQHKDDTNKYGWWVTKRDADNNVLEDIII